MAKLSKKLSVDYKQVMIGIPSTADNGDTLDLSSLIGGIETKIYPANRFTRMFWKKIKVSAQPVLPAKGGDLVWLYIKEKKDGKINKK